MKGAKLTMKANSSAIPTNEKLAAALRKKRAQQIAEQKFNQASPFSGISQGELEMLLEDDENSPRPEPDAPLKPLTIEEEIALGNMMKVDVRTDKERKADEQAAAKRARLESEGE